MNTNLDSDPSSKSLDFCWYPSFAGESFVSALGRSLERFGPSQFQFDQVVGFASAAIEKLRQGDLWLTRSVREIKSSDSEMFELRLDLGITESVGLVRIYCHLLKSHLLILGLVIQIKEVLQDRALMREMQNHHIILAQSVFEMAKEEQFSRCLVKEDSNE